MAGHGPVFRRARDGSEARSGSARSADPGGRIDGTAYPGRRAGRAPPHRTPRRTHSAAPLPGPRRARGRQGLRQAREPPGARRVQDAGGAQRRLDAQPRREAGRRRSGLYRELRTGRGPRRADLRSAGQRRRARGRQPQQGQVDASARRESGLPRREVRRLAGARRAALQGGGAPVHPLGQRMGPGPRRRPPIRSRSWRTCPRRT